MSARAPRFSTKYPVVLRQGPEMFASTICNISEGGACLLGNPWLQKGDRMMIDYAVGQTRATVMWRVGQMAGVKFDDLLSTTGLNCIRALKETA